MDKVDADYLKEIIKTSDAADSGTNTDVKVKHDGTTYEEILVSAHFTSGPVISVPSLVCIAYAL